MGLARALARCLFRSEAFGPLALSIILQIHPKAFLTEQAGAPEVSQSPAAYEAECQRSVFVQDTADDRTDLDQPRPGLE